MTSKDNRTPIQHGECLLVPVNKLPKEQTSKVSTQIVAHSETGHHHVIEADQEFEVMGSLERQDLYLRLFEPAKLVHKKQTEKHRDIIVPKGDWKILHKSEYDPWAKIIRRVED